MEKQLPIEGFSFSLPVFFLSALHGDGFCDNSHKVGHISLFPLVRRRSYCSAVFQIFSCLLETETRDESQLPPDEIGRT